MSSKANTPGCGALLQAEEKVGIQAQADLPRGRRLDVVMASYQCCKAEAQQRRIVGIVFPRGGGSLLVRS